MSKSRKIVPILRTHKKKTLKEEPLPTIPIQEVHIFTLYHL